MSRSTVLGGVRGLLFPFCSQIFFRPATLTLPEPGVLFVSQKGQLPVVSGARMPYLNQTGSLGNNLGVVLAANSLNNCTARGRCLFPTRSSQRSNVRKRHLCITSTSRPCCTKS